MNKREFLKLSGLAGMSALIPSAALRAIPVGQENASCVLIPSETEGPFPLDLTANNTFLRQDIRESKTGVQLNVKLKIVSSSDCEPLSNARVNIWHCDKDGLYSGYDTNNNAGQAGLTYLRGWQMTDANGEVDFVTIFPGWYNGRICHIHFQVYVSTNYSVVSQLTFPVATKNAIYSANSGLYTKGTDPMALNSDNIFSDGYSEQMATLTANSTTGGYDSYLEIAVNADGTTGVGQQERLNEQQFELGQNYPNPFRSSTAIPISLNYASTVKLDLYDLYGRPVANVFEGELSSGKHELKVALGALGISSANYLYQMEVRNSNGTFRDVKMMTAGQ